MKKNKAFYCSLYLILLICTLCILNYTSKKSINSNNISAKNSNLDSYIDFNIDSNIYDLDIFKNKSKFNLAETTNDVKNNVKKEDIALKSKPINSKKISSNNRVRLSRGDLSSNTRQNTKTKNNTYASNIRLLDWKLAQNIFTRDCEALVTDVYTKKSFKVKRTMGTNHADAESLTKEDTRIIKEIWGGFSWDRRPVIVRINGQNLAASMSGMPHAGIDSAPAFEIVNNRSQGYGRGQNLDVIKNNDMDGHFDIHFLNSTRHMDGKKDPQHQNAILVASKLH